MARNRARKCKACGNRSYAGDGQCNEPSCWVKNPLREAAPVQPWRGALPLPPPPPPPGPPPGPPVWVPASASSDAAQGQQKELVRAGIVSRLRLKVCTVIIVKCEAILQAHYLRLSCLRLRCFSICARRMDQLVLLDNHSSAVNNRPQHSQYGGICSKNEDADAPPQRYHSRAPACADRDEERAEVRVDPVPEPRRKRRRRRTHTRRSASPRDDQPSTDVEECPAGRRTNAASGSVQHEGARAKAR